MDAVEGEVELLSATFPATLLAFQENLSQEIRYLFVNPEGLATNESSLCILTAIIQSDRNELGGVASGGSFPKQLRLHPALDELGWVGVVGELNEAAGLSSQSVSGQILITSDGIILTGIGRWRLAVFERRHAIPCNECLLPLDEDEALQFIISHHQPQRGWNAFIRIRLALKLEPYFQQRALDNMRAGGKYKGLAKLPEAQHIDVRQAVRESGGARHK